MKAPNRRAVLTVSLLIALAVGGCGGRRIALSDRIAPDPALEWVFDAGMELVLDWWGYPRLTPGWISTGARVEGHVVLLCNLGGASEDLMASRAYVLDLETGRVLKRIRGPTRTGYEGFITPDLAYFKADTHEGWVAFDLRKGRVLWDPPAPNARMHPRPSELAWSQTEYDPSTGLRRYQCLLGSGRALLVEGKPFDWQTFDLSWEDAEGIRQVRRLCRLPNRAYAMGGACLIEDDERRLVFTWGGYAFCVDVRCLASANDSAMTDEAIPCPIDHQFRCGRGASAPKHLRATVLALSIDSDR